jgi:hypothetical protein
VSAARWAKQNPDGKRPFQVYPLDAEQGLAAIILIEPALQPSTQLHVPLFRPLEANPETGTPPPGINMPHAEIFSKNGSR